MVISHSSFQAIAASVEDNGVCREPEWSDNQDMGQERTLVRKLCQADTGIAKQKILLRLAENKGNRTCFDICTREKGI